MSVQKYVVSHCLSNQTNQIDWIPRERRQERPLGPITFILVQFPEKFGQIIGVGTPTFGVCSPPPRLGNPGSATRSHGRRGYHSQ